MGQRTLALGAHDPVLEVGDAPVLRALGFIEPLPLEPREPPRAENARYGSTGLVKSLDRGKRRHVYTVGYAPVGSELVGELGATAPSRFGTHGLTPFWIDETGALCTDRYVPERPRPAPATVARWVGAPLGWSARPGAVPALARASGRRLLDARRPVGTTSYERRGERPSGWLYPGAAEGRTPLYSSIHPVTGDQLLSTSELEGSDMGFAGTTLLGHLLVGAPVTGGIGGTRPDVPWASRFGRTARVW